METATLGILNFPAWPLMNRSRCRTGLDKVVSSVVFCGELMNENAPVTPARWIPSRPRMIRITSFRQFLGYLVAVAMVVIGVLVVTGNLLTVFIQTEQLRLVFGSVLILYGVFRFFSAYYSEKRTQETRSILEDDSWKSSGS